MLVQPLCPVFPWLRLWGTAGQRLEAKQQCCSDLLGPLPAPDAPQGSLCPCGARRLPVSKRPVPSAYAPDPAPSAGSGPPVSVRGSGGQDQGKEPPPARPVRSPQHPCSGAQCGRTRANHLLTYGATFLMMSPLYAQLGHDKEWGSAKWGRPTPGSQSPRSDASVAGSSC